MFVFFQITRKNALNLDNCAVLVNSRNVNTVSTYWLDITLKYVSKFLLATMEILLIFLVAIAISNLLTETIRTLSFFYFTNLRTFANI